MKCLSNWLVLFFFTALFILPCVVLAEEYEEVEYAYGSIISVNSEKMILKEYDFDNEEELENAYFFDSNVELINIETIENLKPGDIVDIDFFKKAEKKIIIAVMLDIYED